MLLLTTIGNAAARKRQSFRVGEHQFDPIREPRRRHFFPGHGEHALRCVDATTRTSGSAAAQFDWNLSGAGAEIEHLQSRHVPALDWSLKRPIRQGGEEIRDERLVHRGMIHRIVLARILVAFHHFGF